MGLVPAGLGVYVLMCNSIRMPVCLSLCMTQALIQSMSSSTVRGIGSGGFQIRVDPEEVSLVFLLPCTCVPLRCRANQGNRVIFL